MTTNPQPGARKPGDDDGYFVTLARYRRSVHMSRKLSGASRSLLLLMLDLFVNREAFRAEGVLEVFPGKGTLEKITARKMSAVKKQLRQVRATGALKVHRQGGTTPGGEPENNVYRLSFEWMHATEKELASAGVLHLYKDARLPGAANHPGAKSYPGANGGPTPGPKPTPAPGAKNNPTPGPKPTPPPGQKRPPTNMTHQPDHQSDLHQTEKPQRAQARGGSKTLGDDQAEVDDSASESLWYTYTLTAAPWKAAKRAIPIRSLAAVLRSQHKKLRADYPPDVIRLAVKAAVEAAERKPGKLVLPGDDDMWGRCQDVILEREADEARLSPRQEQEARDRYRMDEKQLPQKADEFVGLFAWLEASARERLEDRYIRLRGFGDLRGFDDDDDPEFVAHDHDLLMQAGKEFAQAKRLPSMKDLQRRCQQIVSERERMA